MRRVGKPSVMVRNFLNFDPAAYEASRYEEPPFKKQHYFLLGPLMDPSTLSQVLGTDGMPELKPATVFGFKCKLWGSHPVLSDELCRDAVHGVAYEVQTAEEKQKLVDYHGPNYDLGPCTIHLDDATWVWGRIFKWDVDESLLTEGTFNIEVKKKGHT
jgi:hypothetical protein